MDTWVLAHSVSAVQYAAENFGTNPTKQGFWIFPCMTYAEASLTLQATFLYDTEVTDVDPIFYTSVN